MKALRESNGMNTLSSVCFRGRTRCALALIALGVVLVVVLPRHHPAIGSEPLTPGQETRALPQPVADAKLSPAEIPVTTTSKEEPSAVSSPAKEAALVSIPPLARAVPVIPNTASVGVGSPENKEPLTVDPPLAFTVNPKNLTPAQQIKLAAIQDQFLKAIGDANQNPADPAYNERWRSAQSVADQTYRADFGWSAFVQMQVERAQNSYTEIRVP
jgi:hypothetical protein